MRADRRRGTFATAVNCMDGRTIAAVLSYLKRRFRVRYVNMITEPGPARILALRRDRTLLASVKRRAAISVRKHGSRRLAVAGHHDCAGNPVDKKTQLGHIRRAVRTVRSWGFDAEVVGLWVDRNWKVHPV